MTSRLLLLSAWLLLLIPATAPTASAEQPYLEFLQALRDKSYFDYALLYLDQIAQRPGLPDDMKPTLLYERAITHRDYAKVLRNPEKQYEQLDLSLAFLEQFAREYPEHPNSADANSDRAQILLQRAEVEIFQAKSPTNHGSKVDFQKRARELVKKARDVLKVAYDQHEAAAKKFPAFINEQTEPKLHAERARVERSLILESLSLAKCTYNEAETYDSTAPEFKQLLNQAADEFEKMHQKNRSQVGGLYARAWQGKCYEEQGDLQKALGIYNELLEHPGNDASLQSLKAQTLLFKLICLNARNDFQLIVDLGDAWLKDNSNESKTSMGLGIQWEQARAFESLGDNRNLPKSEQERYWRLGQKTAQSIARYQSEFKDVALSMQQRLQVKLGKKDVRPEVFGDAYGLGRAAFDSAQEIKKELDVAVKNQKPADEIARLRQDWNSALLDAEKNLELAMRLVNRRDNAKDVATARLYYAYTNYNLRRNYEAAVLAQYVARTANDDEGSVAMDAAYMAMAAFIQAYNDNRAEPEKKTDDMRLIINAANLIAARWPESEKSNEARMVLGRMYSSNKQPAEAAEWFSKVPESDPKFAEAQLSAGQAYWAAYGAASRRPAESRPSPEKLAEWKTSAEKFLRNGLGKLSATLPAEGAVPPELVSGKIYLAELLHNQGRDVESAKMLLDDPQSVVKAVTVADEKQRPEKGIQSRTVAKTVYTLLMYAYIGMGDKLNEARDTMKTLESIAAGDPNSDLTDLYVGLGKQLKSELEQFRNNGETERFNKSMQAFEAFVDDLYKKQDGQTFGSLSWIGEQYFALGEISPDSGKTASCFERASNAYGQILTRAQSDSSFVTPEQLLNVKVRLVHSNRMKRDFEHAEQLLMEVLKARGNDLRTQTEGAHVYQDWGTHGDNKKFVFAVTGKKDIGLWGWGGVANRIKQQKNYTERPEFLDAFFDARYNASLCRFRYAKELNPKQKQTEFDTCVKELLNSSTIMRTIADDKRAKLNQLYRDVLQASGKTVTDLPRPEDPPPIEPAKSKASTEDVAAEPKPDAEKAAAQQTTEKAKDAGSSDTVTMIVFIVLLLGGLAMGAWMFMKGQKPKTKPKTISKGAPEPALSFGGIASEQSAASGFSIQGGAKPRPKPVVAKEGKPKEGKPEGAAPATGSAAAARPAATRPASKPAAPRPEGQAAPPAKPRPRPPAPPADQ